MLWGLKLFFFHNYFLFYLQQIEEYSALDVTYKKSCRLSKFFYFRCIKKKFFYLRIATICTICLKYAYTKSYMILLLFFTVTKNALRILKLPKKNSRKIIWQPNNTLKIEVYGLILYVERKKKDQSSTVNI